MPRVYLFLTSHYHINHNGFKKTCEYINRNILLLQISRKALNVPTFLSISKMFGYSYSSSFRIEPSLVLLSRIISPFFSSCSSCKRAKDYPFYCLPLHFDTIWLARDCNFYVTIHVCITWYCHWR